MATDSTEREEEIRARLDAVMSAVRSHERWLPVEPSSLGLTNVNYYKKLAERAGKVDVAVADLLGAVSRLREHNAQLMEERDAAREDLEQSICDRLHEESDSAATDRELARVESELVRLREAFADEQDTRRMLDEELNRVSGLLASHSESSHSTVSAHLADVLAELVASRAALQSATERATSEQALHEAWRKRATEAETALAVKGLKPFVVEEMRGLQPLTAVQLAELENFSREMTETVIPEILAARHAQHIAWLAIKDKPLRASSPGAGSPAAPDESGDTK